ncbi:hypothetical protein C8F04DRAFT_1265947 [Mycena alexandri]|uniref:Uncharacterized protein n=1 Tax=Mycena alexandri TaxID=1745969 RepID=A0AAD6SI25_9AGAR|nr:hypothetical protein C8F04DRAFT_1265947 [Mycena alexandri]
MRQSTCDIKTCVLDLAPSVIACAGAAAQAGVDPISDAGYIHAGPASCTGCADQLGVSGDIASAENAIEGLF